jgi:hypothetical protein
MQIYDFINSAPDAAAKFFYMCLKYQSSEALLRDENFFILFQAHALSPHQ